MKGDHLALLAFPSKAQTQPTEGEPQATSFRKAVHSMDWAAWPDRESMF